MSRPQGRWQARGWAYQFWHEPVSAEAPPRKVTRSTTPRIAAARVLLFCVGGPADICMKGARWGYKTNEHQHNLLVKIAIF